MENKLSKQILAIENETTIDTFFARRLGAFFRAVLEGATASPDNSISERLASLEAREDKVGITKEQAQQLITAAIAAIPEDQVQNAEQVRDIVEPLLTALPTVHTYDDTELRGEIRKLEAREDKIGITEEQAQHLITAAIAAIPEDQVKNAEQVRAIVEPLLQTLPKVQTYNDAEILRRLSALEERTAAAGISEQRAIEIIDGKLREVSEGYSWFGNTLKTLTKILSDFPGVFEEIPSNSTSDIREIGEKMRVIMGTHTRDLSGMD